MLSARSEPNPRSLSQRSLARAQSRALGAIRAIDPQDVLKRCILFQALDDQGQRELAHTAHPRKYAAGAAIFQVGDPGDSMMAVLAGAVRITLPTPKGREVVLADVDPGDVFGEIAMLDGAERSAAATALTNCELLVLERSQSLLFLQHHPEACLKLLELLCARVRRSDERMLDIGFSEIPVRLAKVLLEHANEQSRLPLSQSELAAMIGATRENVNRHLRDWQSHGILERKKGWIVILQQSRLATIAATG